MTIYGYTNNRFFVPANNPHGHRTWFATRAERDAALARLEADAAIAGLADPRFRRIIKRLRSAVAHDWFERLCAQGIMYGHDEPGDSWESAQ